MIKKVPIYTKIYVKIFDFIPILIVTKNSLEIYKSNIDILIGSHTFKHIKKH